MKSARFKEDENIEEFISKTYQLKLKLIFD